METFKNSLKLHIISPNVESGLDGHPCSSAKLLIITELFLLPWNSLPDIFWLWSGDPPDLRTARNYRFSLSVQYRGLERKRAQLTLSAIRITLKLSAIWAKIYLHERTRALARCSAEHIWTQSEHLATERNWWLSAHFALSFALRCSVHLPPLDL